MMNSENLTKALHSADFALAELLAANRTASPPAALLLLDLIGQQRAVGDRLRAILNAIGADQ